VYFSTTSDPPPPRIIPAGSLRRVRAPAPSRIDFHRRGVPGWFSLDAKAVPDLWPRETGNRGQFSFGSTKDRRRGSPLSGALISLPIMNWTARGGFESAGEIGTARLRNAQIGFFLSTRGPVTFIVIPEPSRKRRCRNDRPDWRGIARIDDAEAIDFPILIRKLASH